jgi:trimeric autotransporter adhesin
MTIKATYSWMVIGATLGLSACDSATEVEMTKHDLLAGMSFYFGNLHAHTKYSDGEQTPAQGFAWARDTAHMAFYTVTDHAELLSNSEWNNVGTQADAYNADGTFVAMRGFEYTNYFTGHINVFDTTSARSFWSSLTLSSFYSWLDSKNGIGQFNHPGDPSDFDGFSKNSKVLDNMALLETANGDTTNASGTYVGYYNAALRNGWKVAPTGNNDNHSLSDSGRRTVLVAESLTRGNLLSALRARRMYSSDDPNVEIAFVLNGSWMGSTVAGNAGTYTFNVAILDDEPIHSVELVVNGTVAAAQTPPAGTSQLTWNPALTVTADTYAYLKVTEADGQVALTAPIWIDVP